MAGVVSVRTRRLVAWRWCTHWRCSHALAILKAVLLACWTVRLIDLWDATSPFAHSTNVDVGLGRLVLVLSSGSTPAGVWRHTHASLICLRVDILRSGCIVLVTGSASTTSEKLQTSLDVSVTRIKLSRASIRVQSICGLVVTTLIL